MDPSSKLNIVYSLFTPNVATIAGAFTNAYITLVILFDYFQTKIMSASNKVLVALSLSNVYVSLILSVNSIISFFWPQMYAEPYVKGYILALLIFGIASCAWTTTCLCVFYFVKIINFSSRLLTSFKMRINILVPWLILFSEVVSLGCSFLTLLPYANSLEPSSNTTLFYSVNSTSGVSGIYTGFMKVTFVAVSLPLLIIFVTTFSTIGSLYLHSRRMESTGTTNSVTPHRSAVCMMAWLLLLYTVIFVVLFSYFLHPISPPSFGYWMSYNLIYVFTLVQSVVLIQGNPKLKEAFARYFNGFC
uniref:Taste receptor type 2 n=1 Tax=Xenopus tropicalis TaxID=8364 RepID=A0A6I8PQA3_XENTR